MIYFHIHKFNPLYQDLVKVEDMETVTSSRMGMPISVSEIITEWFKTHPDGSITITNETR